MKEQFIPYELALRLKKLGFDEKCFRVWIGKNVLRNEEFKNSGRFENLYICSAPLWQQAFDFFREKYDYHSYIGGNSKEFVDNFIGVVEGQFSYFITHTLNQGNTYLVYFDNYQEARQACLEKLIEIAQKTVEKI